MPVLVVPVPVVSVSVASMPVVSVIRIRGNHDRPKLHALPGPLPPHPHPTL